MKEANQKPNLAAGIFAVIFGAICFVLAVFVATDSTQKLWGIVFGVILLAWGSSQIVAARRQKK